MRRKRRPRREFIPVWWRSRLTRLAKFSSKFKFQKPLSVSLTWSARSRASPQLVRVTSHGSFRTLPLDPFKLLTMTLCLIVVTEIRLIPRTVVVIIRRGQPIMLLFRLKLRLIKPLLMSEFLILTNRLREPTIRRKLKLKIEVPGPRLRYCCFRFTSHGLTRGNRVKLRPTRRVMLLNPFFRARRWRVSGLTVFVFMVPTFIVRPLRTVVLTPRPKTLGQVRSLMSHKFRLNCLSRSSSGEALLRVSGQGRFLVITPFNLRVVLLLQLVF